jgi:thiol-disulfide isomerase/thioredoxin
MKTDTLVLDDKPTLVLYWADWCGWSKKMLPDWKKVATILNDSSSGMRAIAFEEKEDSAEITKAKNAFGNQFQGFPHIRLFPDGYDLNKPSIPYSGNDRSEESLLSFAYSGGK